MKFEAYGKTDVGRVRTNNEDAFLIDEEIKLFVVADGMGGHKAGEVASKMAVETIRDNMRRFLLTGQKGIVGKIDPKFGEKTNQLASGIRLSNQLIYESAKINPAQKGMGTTVDCVLLDKSKISIGHIGDSRVYAVRSAKLYQLTQDHSLVEEQVRQGLITHEEADRSSLKNILTRALGVDPSVEVDLIESDVFEGDVLICCTDGLNKVVSDDQILKAVQEMKSPKMIAEHLIDLANVAGGVDNTTVIVIKVEK
jgi:protein phosphatase